MTKKKKSRLCSFVFLLKASQPTELIFQCLTNAHATYVRGPEREVPGSERQKEACLQSSKALD